MPTSGRPAFRACCPADSAGPRPSATGVDLRTTVNPSVPDGQDMIVPLPPVVVVLVVMVEVEKVVDVEKVGKVVVVKGGIVIVDSPVGGWMVIDPVVGGPTGIVPSLELAPAGSSSSVAASATIAPAASATSRSATSAIQSQTGDSRDQTTVRV